MNNGLSDIHDKIKPRRNRPVSLQSSSFMTDFRPTPPNSSIMQAPLYRTIFVKVQLGNFLPLNFSQVVFSTQDNEFSQSYLKIDYRGSVNPLSGNMPKYSDPRF